MENIIFFSVVEWASRGRGKNQKKKEKKEEEVYFETLFSRGGIVTTHNKRQNKRIRKTRKGANSDKP